MDIIVEFSLNNLAGFGFVGVGSKFLVKNMGPRYKYGPKMDRTLSILSIYFYELFHVIWVANHHIHDFELLYLPNII